MDQPNLSANSGIHTSLHPNCHHQSVQSKFDVNIFYPPRYQRIAQDYKKADAFCIQKLPDLVNLEMFFLNKNIDLQVSIFNAIILNIFSNFVPNETITCNNKRSYLDEREN